MRRLPSFFSLRAFEAAARHGSFTEAGKELSLTPSAISHQVRSLEEWLGKQLFARSVRKVTLTDDGLRLLATLTPAFDMIEEGCAALKPAAQGRGLSVHCAPSFAAKWLSPRLPDFMRKHPSITIRMSSSAEPVDLQKAHDIDIEISYGAPPARSNVSVEALGLEKTVPLCSTRLLDKRPPTAPQHLSRFTLIESKLNPVKWADWWKLNGLKLPDQARSSFDRGSMAVAAAADGLGVALETTRFAEVEIARGELVAIEGPAFIPVFRETHFLCYRNVDRNNPELAAFRSWLNEQLSLAPNTGMSNRDLAI
jgi:LysR family glycine cleavage system transcriptional activator